MNILTLIVKDEIGFHARTATLFAEEAGKFSCDIQVRHRNKVVNGKSMLRLMTLGVKKNSKISIMAEGEDAHAALSRLKYFIENGTGE